MITFIATTHERLEPEGPIARCCYRNIEKSMYDMWAEPGTFASCWRVQAEREQSELDEKKGFHRYDGIVDDPVIRAKYNLIPTDWDPGPTQEKGE